MAPKREKSQKTKRSSKVKFNDSIVKNQLRHGMTEATDADMTLRRSQRYRKSVNFYGNVITASSVSKISKSSANSKKARGSTGIRKFSSHLSVISISNRRKKRVIRIDMEETKCNLIETLKQKGYPLPAVRCINKTTGECQIGIPKTSNKFFTDSQIPDKSRFKITTSEINDRRLYNRTQQEDAILENLVSLVPYEPETGLTQYLVKEFCDELINDLEKSPHHEIKKNIPSNDDSKYYWL